MRRIFATFSPWREAPSSEKGRGAWGGGAAVRFVDSMGVACDAAAGVRPGARPGLPGSRGLEAM